MTMTIEDAIEQASWTPMPPPAAPDVVAKAWKGQTSDWTFIIVAWEAADGSSSADGTASSPRRGLIVRLLPAQAKRAAELAGK
jgi:hypothetical protein